MHFGATLRLLRVHAGWTLRELAQRIGVSNAYLSRVENGHDAPPTPDRLAAIAQALDLPASTLVELADRIGPFTSDYVERVPAARELVMDLLRRELGPVEIARVRGFVEREFPMPTGGRADARALAAMLDPSRVVLGLSCSDIEDVIDVAATKLAGVAGRSAREIGGAILARERSCSSALGAGLSVPHTIVEAAKPGAVVVTLRHALDGETPDGAPLRTFIVHVHRGGAAHAQVLAQMARLAEASMVATLSGAADSRQVIAAIVDAGRSA